MGRSSIRDESSNWFTKKKKESSKSHKVAALTNSPYDEDMEEIEEDEKPDPHRVERSELVEGDHIYKWSASTAYAHHGICIGHDMVIHFVNLTEGSSSSTPGLPGLLSKLTKAASTPSGPSSIARSSQMISTASSLASNLHGRYLKSDKSSRGMELLTCSNSVECGYGPFGTGVLLNCLNCFLRRKNYSLCRYEYGVSRSTFEREVRGGTCTTAESDSPEEVIQRARYLHEKGFGKYHLEKNNCEDFALYCKTGLLVPNKSAPATSGQINYALSSLSSGEKLPGQVTTHGSKRYFRDIGVRNDVMKVEVKNVAVVLNRRVGLNEVPAD